MKRLDVPHPLVRVTPVYYGYFENNDPRDRMIAIVNYNNDLAEYWEFSDTGMFALDFTNDAYKLAVNYVIYAHDPLIRAGGSRSSRTELSRIEPRAAAVWSISSAPGRARRI